MRVVGAFVSALCLLALAIVGVHTLVSIVTGADHSVHVAGLAVQNTPTAATTTPTPVLVREQSTPRTAPLAPHPRSATRHLFPGGRQPHHVLPRPTATPSFIAVSGAPPIPSARFTGVGGAQPPVLRISAVSPRVAEAGPAVSLERYWIAPTMAQPGRRIFIWFVISNRTGMILHLVLGASIKPVGASNWTQTGISDRADDMIATVAPGTSTHLRAFTLPSHLRPGWYDVAWGLRGAVTHRRLAIAGMDAALHVLK